MRGSLEDLSVARQRERRNTEACISKMTESEWLASNDPSAMLKNAARRGSTTSASAISRVERRPMADPASRKLRADSRVRAGVRWRAWSGAAGRAVGSTWKTIQKMKFPGNGNYDPRPSDPGDGSRETVPARGSIDVGPAGSRCRPPP